MAIYIDLLGPSSLPNRLSVLVAQHDGQFCESKNLKKEEWMAIKTNFFFRAFFKGGGGLFS